MPDRLNPVIELRATANHLRRLAQVGREDKDYAARMLHRAAELDEEADRLEGSGAGSTT